MLEEILPACAVAVEAHGDIGEAISFPDEQAIVARAVGKRQREFATTRACARQALARLGVAAVPIPRGVSGEPIWPTGIVGSMSHCPGYRASAVAREADLLSLGVDAEEHAALPPGVLNLITITQEREHLRELTADYPDIHWGRVLFSVKESVYKAWFPLAGRWLGFKDAVVRLDPSTGKWAAELLVTGPTVDGAPLSTFHGQWLVRDTFIVAAVALRPDSWRT